MRGLFWIIALFALAIGVSFALSGNEGYVLIVVPPWRAEVSLNLVIIALLLFFFLLHSLLRAAAATLSLPGRVRAYREQLRQKKGGRLFSEAVRLLFEGRYGHALKKAGEAHALGHAPGLSALIAARAAQRLRESDKQQAWLEHAVRDDDATLAARLMLEAEMFIDARRFVEALAVLARLQSVSGRHLAALRLELRARQGNGEWIEVLRLARQLEKRGALNSDAAREVKSRAHEGMLAAAVDARELLATYAAIPAAELGGRLAHTVAETLYRMGRHAEAQRIIAAQLEREWNPVLVRMYGLADGGDVVGRIAQAEQWLAAHPDAPCVLLALGRLCYAQRLWGKAQSYLDAALSLGESSEVRLELARLADELGQTAEADRHYRAAARLANHSAPSLPT